jgi:hypothetical protein
LGVDGDHTSLDLLGVRLLGKDLLGVVMLSTLLLDRLFDLFEGSRRGPSPLFHA